MSDGTWTAFDDWNCVRRDIIASPVDAECQEGIWSHQRLSSLQPAIGKLRDYLQTNLKRILALKENREVRLTLAQMMVDLIHHLHTDTVQRGTGDAMSQRYAYVLQGRYSTGAKMTDTDDGIPIEDGEVDLDREEVDTRVYFDEDALET
tara:strand:+ start:87 stop:533 length:447 start_codon:yes stop_codon:yes gene_type:complete